MNRNKLSTLVLLVLPLACPAQTQGSEQDGAVFLDAVVMSKRGPLCALRIPGYAEKFEASYAKWRLERSASLAAGEVALRAAAAKDNIDFDMQLRIATDYAARQLGKSSQVELEINCEAMLRRLGAP